MPADLDQLRELVAGAASDGVTPLFLIDETSRLASHAGRKVRTWWWIPIA